VSKHWRADDLGLKQFEALLTGRRPLPDRICLEQLTQWLADLREIWNKLEIRECSSNKPWQLLRVDWYRYRLDRLDV
jgi:hypothetical protein